MLHKQKTKQEVLGKIAKPKPAGRFAVAPESIKNPLAYEGTVVRCFCLGCGNSTELLFEGAEKLTKKAKAETPTNWQGYYFKAKKCVLCSRDYQGISLKNI